jgi:peptidoglycan/xylan/chitin deacetylase (PgdA/CDA1 family)
MLASALAKSGALRLAREFGAGRGQQLAVLAYHRVLPSIDAGFSGDEELVSALLEDFEWQVNFLARHCNVLTVAQLLSVLRGQAELPPRAVLVTFDDGCIDAVRYASPALSTAGVPAIFFVSSGYIGTRDLYWFDDVFHRFVHSPRDAFRLESLDLEIRLPPDPAGRKRAAEPVVRALKRADRALHVEALQEIRSACEVVLAESVIDANRPMNWEEVGALVRQGMSVGSHSVTHPVLAGLDDRELSWELEESRRTIESRLEAECRLIAYPLGGDQGYSVSGAIAVDDRVRRFAAAAGYEAGFTYVPGVARIGQDDPLLFNRVPVERYLTRDEFAARLALPGVFV